MSVPSAGDNERDPPQLVSRATIANIVRQRAEEIFEMVRDRLADSPFAAERRGLPADRRRGTRKPDSGAAGADRPSAWIWAAAQRGEERIVCGSLGAPG